MIPSSCLSLENKTVKSSDAAFRDKEHQHLGEERGEAHTGGHDRMDGKEMRS